MLYLDVLSCFSFSLSTAVIPNFDYTLESSGESKNEDENTSYQNLCDKAKAMLREGILQQLVLILRNLKGTK